MDKPFWEKTFLLARDSQNPSAAKVFSYPIGMDT
jgi:hypothetical protein